MGRQQSVLLSSVSDALWATEVRPNPTLVFGRDRSDPAQPVRDESTARTCGYTSHGVWTDRGEGV